MKKIEDLRMTFEFNSDSATGCDGACHNRSESKFDGKGYDVYILIKGNKDIFRTYAYPVESTDDEAIEKEFED